MPIKDFVQPNIIQIDKALRLRKFDNHYAFALGWYQDDDTVKLVDGLEAKAYDIAKLRRIYEFLNQKGELYFIEVLNQNQFMPIGDVAFWKDDLPIVIGDKAYRGKGIGKKVLKALIKRGKHYILKSYMFWKFILIMWLLRNYLKALVL